MQQLPKLSYVLLVYNREQYIRKAIESAFAQDYKGELEIIISDDCSPDSSYDIIKECAAAYRGPHRIIITQTPNNLYLAGHTNHALQFVTSDWVIRADDDDYSSPDRCSLIGEAINKYPDSTYIATDFIYFKDSKESEILEQIKNIQRPEKIEYQITDAKEGYKVNSLHDFARYDHRTWNMKVYKIFGDLDANAYYVDDLCSYYRAIILGRGIILKNTLCTFLRTDINNQSRGCADSKKSYKSIIKLENFNDKYYNVTLEPLKRDYQLYLTYFSKQSKERQLLLQDFIDSIQQNIKKHEQLAQYWRKGIFYRLKMRKEAGSSDLFSLCRCLPLPLFALTQTVYRIIRKKIQ